MTNNCFILCANFVRVASARLRYADERARTPEPLLLLLGYCLDHKWRCLFEFCRGCCCCLFAVSRFLRFSFVMSTIYSISPSPLSGNFIVAWQLEEAPLLSLAKKDLIILQASRLYSIADICESTPQIAEDGEQHLLRLLVVAR